MSEDKDSGQLELIEYLNSEFGGDLFKLENAENVLRKLTEWENDLHNKLMPKKDEESQIVNFSESGKVALQKISTLLQKHDHLQALSKKQIEILKPVRDSFLPHLDSIKQLGNAHNYLLWLSAIEHENEAMTEALKQNLPSEIVGHFRVFKMIWSQLGSSQCKNLVKYCENTMVYWHDILKEKFGSEFLKVLGCLHWPVKSAVASVQLKPSEETITKFKNLFMILLRIQLPDDFNLSVTNKKTSENLPFLLPLQLMFEPLEKRFYFHFMTKKQTNNIEKPEWYLAQVLTWITDHQSFLKRMVQPLLEEQVLDTVTAYEELMRCLVQLAIARFRKDLPVLLEADDGLLSHTLDEIFLFERELEYQGYPKSCPTLLEVVTTEPCFSRWQSLEHKSALEKMDKLLSSETAWKSRYLEEEELDELQVPECAEMFITLLLTMTERYRHAPKDEHKVCSMELQLELLDDFRLRLHQLSQYQVEETLDAKYCAILNAINYILIVLYEWSNLPFYLKLSACMKNRCAPAQLKASPKKAVHHQMKEPDKEEEKLEGSVFDESLDLLEHMQQDLIQTLCERVLLDIKAKSRGYRKEKWFCMATVQDKKLLEVSPYAYPLLDVINTSLQSLCDLLAKPLFTMVWQNIAKELNVYLYEEVILQNSFSEGGAQQLNFDMGRNLFPIFGSYTLKPENYFRLVKESCILLNLLPAPAFLLKDTLKQQGKNEERVSSLAELTVFTLSPSQALIILSQRNDFNN